MAKRLTLDERRSRDMKKLLDSRDFYDIAQMYRHAPAIHPAMVLDAFEALKTFILANTAWIR